MSPANCEPTHITHIDIGSVIQPLTQCRTHHVQKSPEPETGTTAVLAEPQAEPGHQPDPVTTPRILDQLLDPKSRLRQKPCEPALGSDQPSETAGRTLDCRELGEPLR